VVSKGVKRGKGFPHRKTEKREMSIGKRGHSHRISRGGGWGTSLMEGGEEISGRFIYQQWMLGKKDVSSKRGTTWTGGLYFGGAVFANQKVFAIRKRVRRHNSGGAFSEKEVCI